MGFQEWYFLFKALHIIGFVSWFAALFYLPRLFVYHVEALDKPEAERAVLHAQFSLMEAKLYKIIMTPAMLITFCAGFSMIGMQEGQTGGQFVLNQPWLQIKLVLLVGLAGYHHWCKGIQKRLAQGQRVMSSTQFRLFNEIATLFLVAIVLLAVYKQLLNVGYAFLALLGLGLLLALAVRLYRRFR